MATLLTWSCLLLLQYWCADSLGESSCKASWVVCFLYSHHLAVPFCNGTNSISTSFDSDCLWPMVRWVYFTSSISAQYWLLLVWKLRRSILKEYMMCSFVMLCYRGMLMLCKLLSELLLLKRVGLQYLSDTHQWTSIILYRVCENVCTCFISGFSFFTLESSRHAFG